MPSRNVATILRADPAAPIAPILSSRLVLTPRPANSTLRSRTCAVHPNGPPKLDSSRSHPLP
jgi:hypothetical protein